MTNNQRLATDENVQASAGPKPKKRATIAIHRKKGETAGGSPGIRKPIATGTAVAAVYSMADLTGGGMLMRMFIGHLNAEVAVTARIPKIKKYQSAVTS